MDLSQRRRVVGTDRSHLAGSRGREVLRPLRRNANAARHPSLLEAIGRVDAQLDQAARQEVARWVRDHYETEFGDVPLGFVAQCYLGPPYVDHRLDLVHSIVEHYTPVDVPPEPFAQARMLVRTGAYAFVEVYVSGALRPVFADGSVVF